MCCRLWLIVRLVSRLNKEALHVLILPALFGVRYSYLCSAQDENKLHIVTQSTKMDTLFDLLTDSISFVGFTRLTRLASSTLALPTAPASRRGLYVMERSVCHVVFGRTVVVKEAPGFRALIRRSTSHT